MTAMDFAALVQQCKQTHDYAPLIEAVPYASFLGIDLQRMGNDTIFILSARESNIGNPTLPALHGGSVAGFMEHAAILFLMLEQEIPTVPKTIDFTIDYLRAGLFKSTYAECHMTRQGRRIANVGVRAWQTSRDEPIAIARAHFLLQEGQL